MESPIEVVRRFCFAWSEGMEADALAAFFTDDAVYHNIPLAPVRGREAIANNFVTFILPGPPGVEGLDLRTLTPAGGSQVVATDRITVCDVHDAKVEALDLRIVNIAV